MDIMRGKELIHRCPIGRSESDYLYALSDKVFHTDQLFIYSEKVRPGRCSSAPHSHFAIDEVIYITEGELYAHEGDRSEVLKAGDSVCFHAGSKNKHYLENRSDIDALFLIIRRSTKKEDVTY